MPLLRLEQLCLSYGTHRLLDHTDLSIYRSDRIAIVGRNGAGKSTLLKLIEGQSLPDSGNVWRRGGLRIARLEQEIPAADDRTIYEVVASGLAELGEHLVQYHKLSQQDVQEKELKMMEILQQKIEAADGWNFQQTVDTTLTKLDLPSEKLMSELSGGWRRRVGLARTLVNSPDILLLDEPTNHLDIPTIEWLEVQMKSFDAAIVFISHDRHFLDAISNKIVWLDRGQLSSFKGNYNFFISERERLLEIENRHNALFDKRLAEEEKWIRQGIKARRTRNEGRVRALEALRKKRSERRNVMGNAKFSVDAGESSGKLVVEAKSINFKYQDEPIITNFSTSIMRGDRIGILGPNGAGKSTLIKVLLGKLQPDSGEIKLGTKIEVAYFDQERSQLDPEKTVIDNIAEGRESIEINGVNKHVISYLNDFLFSPERSRTPVKALSGGECNRLLLAKLFSKTANMLVLDEPTNDLDIETLELLEELLMQFKGTILLVSHDRHFMDNVVTSTIFVKGDGSVEEYVGGYADWLRQGGSWKKAGKKTATAFSDQQGKPRAETAASTTASTTKTKKLSYKLQRELDQQPKLIEALEQKISDLSDVTNKPDFYQGDHQEVSQVLADIAALEGELESAYGRWTELEEMEA